MVAPQGGCEGREGAPMRWRLGHFTSVSEHSIDWSGERSEAARRDGRIKNQLGVPWDGSVGRQRVKFGA